MTRKQIIGILVLGVLILAVILFFLGVFVSPLASLAVLLAALLAGGIVYQKSRKEDGPLQRPERPEDQAKRSDRASDYTPRLVLVSTAGGVTKPIVIDRPEFRLGRNPMQCDYVFDDSCNDISAFHAVIYYDESQGQNYIVDQHSKNGTYLNGKRLIPLQWYALNNNDQIQMGSMRFNAQAAHY